MYKERSDPTVNLFLLFPNLLGGGSLSVGKVDRLGLGFVVEILLVDGKLGLLLGGGSCGHFEPGTLLLGTDGGGGSKTQSDDQGSVAHNWTVSLDTFAIGALDKVVLRKVVDELGGRRRDGVAELVSETDEDGTERRWRDLGEVDGNDTPSTLDHGLRRAKR